MIRLLVFLFSLFSLFSLIVVTGHCQIYSNANIFAHNDYATANPFYSAYNLGVGYIEADIFLLDNDLLVAHTSGEIDKTKTLETLYLSPLQTRINTNYGQAYADHSKTLMLMIDLKSEGVSTLNKLVEKLKLFPSLTACKNLFITISGNVPDPALWKNYPDYIYFDGRPEIDYSTVQLKRIIMISTSFRSVSDWNGEGSLPAAHEEIIQSLIMEVHDKGKKMRFWATPDNENSWEIQMRLKMDMIVTDRVPSLAAFIKKKN
jgi:alkaline phosphatase